MSKDNESGRIDEDGEALVTLSVGCSDCAHYCVCEYRRNDNPEVLFKGVNVCDLFEPDQQCLRMMAFYVKDAWWNKREELKAKKKEELKAKKKEEKKK